MMCRKAAGKKVNRIMKSKKLIVLVTAMLVIALLFSVGCNKNKKTMEETPASPSVTDTTPPPSSSTDPSTDNSQSQTGSDSQSQTDSDSQSQTDSDSQQTTSDSAY
jgi:ABC-type oligopeptide transport system substrate-binding subunit